MNDPTTSTLKLTVHPFALKFPRLSLDARSGLKADIELNGQLHPIVINEQGQILDGRHRFEICRELGLEPETVQLIDLLDEKQISEIEFIYSANYHRRHLTDDQRVAINAVFLPEMRRQAQKDKSKGIAAANTRRSKPDVFPLHTRPKPRRRGIETKLANVSGVGHGKSRKAINLSKHAPELLDQVAAGEKKLATAYNEMMASRSSESEEIAVSKDVSEIPETLIPPETLQSKIEQWLDKFLAGFDPAQRPEVLRLVAEVCRTCQEKSQEKNICYSGSGKR